MYGPHKDAKVGQVSVRRWPDRERQERMSRRVAHLTQLLVLKPVEEAEVSVCCSSRDQGLGAIRGAQTTRVGFSVPGRTLLIPPEQGSDATPEPKEPVDDRGRR